MLASYFNHPAICESLLAAFGEFVLEGWFEGLGLEGWFEGLGPPYKTW